MTKNLNDLFFFRKENSDSGPDHCQALALSMRTVRTNFVGECLGIFL